jgi:Flp pilus assembly protein TadD
MRRVRSWPRFSMFLLARSAPSAAACILVASLATLLSACGTSPPIDFSASELPPLQFEGRIIGSDDVDRIEAIDLLAVNDDMRAFVEDVTGDKYDPRSRLLALHAAVKSPATLDLRYDPFADGSAEEVFARGTANCLSYANLFVALAREAGLDARYQWMDVRPEWHRVGGRVALRLHVNVLVRNRRNNEEFMIDIDPLQRHQIAGSNILTDREAEALYYGNQAMQLLSEERADEAWIRAARALELAPDMSHLWVNLGAIYRNEQQYDAAEKAYFRALSTNATDRSAMNNLAVLYGFTDREEEAAYWLDRMHRYRLRNPYYHANLGDIAGRKGDWEDAFEHYAKAVKLQPQDSELIYALGLIEHRRGNADEATRLIEKAIDESVFAVDQQNYRIQLKAIREERAAAL